ncbi:MFS transporter [Lentibacter sp.]|jgi:Na+/melibiose symporter-like transporter|uniref:MFS transporter n=1 Tax=Lentibacter sp. TaxID=2024994 RepID=UPI003F6B895D
MKSDNIGWGTRLAYGIGSIAYGIKDNGFTTFLMIYFNQVLGLPAILVGLSLLIALMFDAVSDPLVGYISDRHKSRWGRRHPFMYAAIVPTCLAYFFMWTPPDLSQLGLFAYLTIMAIVVRLSVTFFEVPNSALIGELTHEYDKRTALSGLRMMIGWLAGVIMAVIVYRVYLAPSVDYDDGIMNLEGYHTYAKVAAIVMCGAMLISSLGTHHAIKHYSQPDPESKGHSFSFVQNIRYIFGNKSFQAVFAGTIFASLVAGIATTLQLYFGVYYFGLSTGQLGLAALTMVPAAIIAFLGTSLLAKGREKKAVVITLSWISMVMSVILIAAKTGGIMPENGSAEMFYVVAIATFFATTVTISVSIMSVSMVVDLVEGDERNTGHRSEGLYFATFSFTRKIVTGLGTFVSGALLTFGATAGVGEVMDEATMQGIALPYAVLMIVLHLASIACVKRFTLTRDGHTENLTAVNKI